MAIKATIHLQKMSLFFAGYLHFQQTVSRNWQFANSQNRLFSSFFSDFHFLAVPGRQRKIGWGRKDENLLGNAILTIFRE